MDIYIYIYTFITITRATITALAELIYITEINCAITTY